MRRIDQSDFIIHFTKGKTNNSSEQGYENFKKILADGKLIGGNFMIRGEYKCVCFTESPIRCLVQGKNSSKNYLEEKYFQRYRPFGFQFSKKHIHQMGGRQVIYSTDNEYLSLPENFKWRFMHHEHYIDGKNSIDFTWEREWRLKEKLIFNNKEVNLVFPNRFWIDRFIKDYESELPLGSICEKETTIVKLENSFETVGQTIRYKCTSPSNLPEYLIDMGIEDYF